MNSKRAKRIRRILKGKDSDWRHVKYIDSPKGEEVPHIKEYPLEVKEWTKGGIKNMTRYIPIKVGTRILDACGRLVYKRAKRIAQTF